jgi:peptidoglycan/LPS O-acetylase OafA/YrhL
MSVQAKTRVQSLPTVKKNGPALVAGRTGIGVARQYYIDWLRVLAVLLLLPFHALRVYNANETFYVKGAHLSAAADVVVDFVSLWHMPLLMLLAGCAAYFALHKRTPRQYLGERLLRLGVPFVFGLFLLCPPQAWYGARFNTGYAASYWTYLANGDFFRFDIGDRFGGFGYCHLWFILALLLISIVLLPLLAWGRGERGGGVMRSISRGLARPLLWPLVPFVIAAGFLVPALPYHLAFDPSAPECLVYFALGYLAVSDKTFMAMALRYRWWALAVGTALAIVWVANCNWIDTDPDLSLRVFLVMYAAGLGKWLILVGILGCGKRFLDRTSPALSYLAEGSYPIYILHQTVIVVLAFYVVGLAAAEPLQWLTLLVSAVAITFALYELVRRFSVTRFLFGMRPLKKRSAAEAPTLEEGPARPSAVGAVRAR